MSRKINKPMNETLRYKNMVANLAGKPRHLIEAELLRELALGRQWRIDAVIDATLKRRENQIFNMQKGRLLVMTAMFGRRQAMERLCDILKVSLDGHSGEYVEEGTNAFHVAVGHGHYKVADVLAERIPSVAMRPPERGQGIADSMFAAVDTYDMKKIKYLMSKGATAEHGLKKAVVSGDDRDALPLVRYFLKAGANPDGAKHDKGMYQPVAGAMRYRRYDVVTALLDAGARPDTPALHDMLYTLCRDPETPQGLKIMSRLVAGRKDDIAPLFMSNVTGSVSPSMLKIIIDAGIPACDSEGFALIAALHNPRAAEIVPMMLAAGADPAVALRQITEQRHGDKAKALRTTLEALAAGKDVFAVAPVVVTPKAPGR